MISVILELTLVRSHPGDTHPMSTLVCTIGRAGGEGGNGEIGGEVGRCLLSAGHHFIDTMFVGSYIKVAPYKFSYSS